MTDWLGSVKDIVSLVADSKAILGVGAGGLALVTGSVAGFIPRVGLVRALSASKATLRLPILYLSGNLRSSS